jgi:hypothetical protein
VSLAPSASLEVGRARFDVHAATVTVTRGPLPEVGRAVLVLPAAAALEAAPGDDAVVELRSGDAAPSGGLLGSIGAAASAASALTGGLDTVAGAIGGALAPRQVSADAVLSGVVGSIERSATHITVEVLDAGAALGAFRPAATYSSRTAGDVARAILRDSSVPAGDVAVDLPIGHYVASQRRTAAEHLAHLAALSGAHAIVRTDGAVDITAWATEPDVVLSTGREISALTVRTSQPPTRPVVLAGNGPAGAPGAPNALQISVAPLPAGAPEPGSAAVWESMPVLRTPSAAKLAGGARTSAGVADATRLRLDAWLLPHVHPGTVLSVVDGPGGTEGPWLVTRVEHRISPAGGATTSIHARAVVAPAGADSLIDAGLSAIGSLL